MPQAGWYPDPSTPGLQRYWDGTAWTPHTAPVPQPLPTPPPYGVGAPGGQTPPPYGVGAPGQPTQFGQPLGHYPPVPGPVPYAVRKEPAVSLLISFFVPGVGSMINGDVGIGAIILVGYLVSWVLVLVLVGIVGVIGFWVWGLVDAYTGAQKWNARHGIMS